mgnify:CR=1 FL=1
MWSRGSECVHDETRALSNCALWGEGVNLDTKF